MIVYTSHPRSKDGAEHMIRLGMGQLIGPYTTSWGKYPRMVYEAGCPLACDNGAYGAYAAGRGWSEYAFLKMLDMVCNNDIRPEFVVCPDIVWAGHESLEFSERWRKRLPGWPLYLAVQDGMGRNVCKYEGYDGIFVGGSVRWKWETAEKWIQMAHAEGKRCHIGRTPTAKHLDRAKEFGADSCDSTNFQRNGYWHHIENMGKQESLL
jgi:hypothetical protein